MRLKRGSLSLILLIFILGEPAALAAQELYLNTTVVSGGGQKTVASIGFVTGGGGEQAVQRLLSHPLPELAAHPAIIPARDLRERLSTLLGRNLVIVGGPLLYLPSDIASQQERTFYTALLQDIEKKLPDQSLRVEAWTDRAQTPSGKDLKGAIAFRFPAGDNTAQAIAANTFLEYKGTGDESFRTLPIHIRIETLVPVATKAFSFGATFSPSEISYKSEDISKLSGTPANLSANAYTANSAISPGSVIYSYMASKVTAISAGKRIRIAFRRGAVEVTVPGSAYQSGGVGDTIAVAPLSSGTRYHGQIVSPTEVVVEH